MPHFEGEDWPHFFLVYLLFFGEGLAASKRADWLLDLNGEQSPFAGMDLGCYLSLVEWTGKNIREDKPGYIPVNLKPVLERFDLNTDKWIANVEGYGGLFYRVVGQVEAIMKRAREKGQHWLQGRSRSEQLYQKQRPAA